MDIKPENLNLSSIAKHFSDEGEAYKFVESIRWPAGPICPHCGVIGHAYFLEPKDGARKTRTGKVSARRVWKCGDCRQQFSVLVGTIFEGSKIPLSKWLLAFHMIASNKNGVAAYELHRTLNISTESAWFMAHRIRYVLDHARPFGKLSGIVEADETYVGGRAHGKRGRGADNKVPVVTLVERDGEARSMVMHKVTSKNLGSALYTHMDRTAELMTDSFGAYAAPVRVA